MKIKEFKKMQIEVSNGEIVDKVTILNIKSKKITSKEKLRNVKKEYLYLQKKMNQIGISKASKEYLDLLKINFKIWELEDKIRELDINKNFGKEFIKVAREIYSYNDRRSILKKEINKRTKSFFTEEKELPIYGS